MFLLLVIIAEQLKLPGIPYEVAKIIKNKYQVRKRLFEVQADDSCQAYIVESKNDIDNIIDRVIFPVMVKPCDGSGSRGTARIDCKEDLRLACENAIYNSLSKKAFIESFVDGIEYGVETFVYNGEVHVLGVMKKWMTSPPNYAELGHAYPSGLDSALEDKIKYSVKRALMALGVEYGPVNMDIIVTGNGTIHIIDIGARMGGNLIYSHLIPLGTGNDYIKNVICSTVGDSVDFSVGNRTPIATALLALQPGIIVSNSDVNDFVEKEGICYMAFLKKQGDVINEYKTNIDGCGYIVVTGDDVKDCHDRAFYLKEKFDKTIVRK